MTPHQSIQLLERLLAEGPFDADDPDPAAAWEVFRDWARYATDCERDELAVSIGYSEEQALAYIEFSRGFGDPDRERDFEVFLRFSAARPDAPRLAELGEHCESPEDLAGFFARVEELPGFALALRYPYWDFEAGWE